jgi:hypothetical protein
MTAPGVGVVVALTYRATVDQHTLPQTPLGGSLFTDGQVHVNGIESFWSCTKRRLARFNGVKANFELHLKECEWGWGKDRDTILAELRKLLVSSLCKITQIIVRRQPELEYGALGHIRLGP